MRLNRLWTTVDGAIADLGDSSRDRRANAGAWVLGHGYDRFSTDERHRLVEALQPVAEADPDAAARAQAIAALVGLRVEGSVDLALAALSDPDRGMRLIVASQMGPTGDPRGRGCPCRLVERRRRLRAGRGSDGLERQGDPWALEPLRAMLRRGERDRAAKASAKRAIRVLKKQASGTGRPTPPMRPDG